MEEKKDENRCGCLSHPEYEKDGCCSSVHKAIQRLRDDPQQQQQQQQQQQYPKLIPSAVIHPSRYFHDDDDDDDDEMYPLTSHSLSKVFSALKCVRECGRKGIGGGEK